MSSTDSKGETVEYWLSMTCPLGLFSFEFTSRHKNPCSSLVFRNGERLKNSTSYQCFLISENWWQICCSPSVKRKKNTKFITCYPAPGKCQWIACFLESFSVVFLCARTLHFPRVFPQNYWRLMSWKHDICLLFSCSTKTLVQSLFPWTFFHSFPKSANATFSQYFHHRITNGECCENMMFFYCFPAPRKR